MHHFISLFFLTFQSSQEVHREGNKELQVWKVLALFPVEIKHLKHRERFVETMETDFVDFFFEQDLISELLTLSKLILG